MLEKRKRVEAERLIQKNTLGWFTPEEEFILDTTRERLLNSGFNKQERVEYLINIIDNDCL